MEGFIYGLLFVTVTFAAIVIILFVASEMNGDVDL